MKIKSRMSTFYSLNIVIVFLCISLIISITTLSHAALLSMSDFDDGTLQGWTAELPFGGVLFTENTGGNPGGFMSVSDTAAGGRLLARSPGFSGDLSFLESIQWDEYVYNIPNTIKGTNIFIRGIDGTLWESDRSFLSFETWITKSVSFNDPLEWTLVSGTASFDSVVANANGLFINMGTTTNVVGPESRVDNIKIYSAIVPEPISSILFVTGGTLLAGRRYIKRKKKA